MTRRVQGAAIAVGLASLLTLSACGGSTSSTSTSKTSTSTSTSTSNSSSSSTTSASSSSGSASKGTYTVGLLAPMTGSRADLGNGMQTGAQLAIDEINAAGGVVGHKLTLKVQDTAADPADAVPAAQALINVDHVNVIVGPTSITDGAILPLVDKANIPNMMFGGGSEFDHNSDAHFFRMSPSDSEQADAMAVYAHQKGWTKVALMFGSNQGSQSLVPPLLAALKKLGIKVTANVSVTPGLSSYLSEVQKVFAGKPQAVLSQMDDPTSGVVFGDVKQLGYAKTPWLGSNLWYTNDWVKSVGTKTAEGPIYIANSSSTGMQGAKAFLSILKQKTGSSTPKNGEEFMYDGVMAWALGADQAGTVSWPKIESGILSASKPPGTACGSYSSCLKLIKSGKQANWEGSASTDDFDQYHNVYGPFAILQYRNGNFATVTTMSPQAIQSALK